MLSSFGRHFSIALLLCSAFATCQPSPGNRPPAVPYTAEFKTTSVSTLANGTSITRETKSIQARDSQWRSFNQSEMPTQPVGGSHSVDTMGSINDPVEGTETNWQSRTHEAWITKLPPLDQRHGCWADDSGTRRAMYDLGRLPSQPGAGTGAQRPQQPQQSQPENVGTTMIQGVEAVGRRFTRTIPAGQIGNDQPMVITNEFWSAPSLDGLVLKSVNDDPRGKTTREITHLDLGEPDPALFQPPAGYEVKTRELHQIPCDQNLR